MCCFTQASGIPVSWCRVIRRYRPCRTVISAAFPRRLRSAPNVTLWPTTPVITLPQPVPPVALPYGCKSRGLFTAIFARAFRFPPPASALPASAPPFPPCQKASGPTTRSQNDLTSQHDPLGRAGGHGRRLSLDRQTEPA